MVYPSTASSQWVLAERHERGPEKQERAEDGGERGEVDLLRHRTEPRPYAVQHLVELVRAGGAEVLAAGDLRHRLERALVGDQGPGTAAAEATAGNADEACP